MKLHLAAIVLLSVSPAFADGGACANCHTASKAQKNDGFIEDPDAFAFLQNQGSPKPAKTQTCATCHTQPAPSTLQPFSFTNKDDQAAINSWLQAQNGQVAVAPEKPNPLTRSIPCKVNCHTPNGDNHLLAQAAGAGWQGFKPIDAATARAFLDAQARDQKDARDTPDPNIPTEGDGDPQGGTPPKPDPKDKQTPAPQTIDSKKGAVTPKKAEKTAQDQLDQTVADQGSGDDFDGSDNGDAVTPDAATKAQTSPKKSPAGETYPKPKGPSSKISDVPENRPQEARSYASSGGASIAKPADSNMEGSLILGGSAGALFGLSLGGPLGMAIGTAVGAGVGALLSWLF